MNYVNTLGLEKAKKIKSLIDVCVDNTIKNYKDAGMTIENDKDDKIDIFTEIKDIGENVSLKPAIKFIDNKLK